MLKVMEPKATYSLTTSLNDEGQTAGTAWSSGSHRK